MGFVQALSFEGKILGQDSVVSVRRYEEAVASLDRSFTIVDGFVHRDPNDQFSRNHPAGAVVNLGNVLRHSMAAAPWISTTNHFGTWPKSRRIRPFGVSRCPRWLAQAIHCAGSTVSPTRASGWNPRSSACASSNSIRRARSSRVRRPKMLFARLSNTKPALATSGAEQNSTRIYST